VLNIVARVEKQLTLSVKLNRLRRFVHAIGTLKVLFSSLLQLSLGSVHNLVQVIDLAEGTLRVSAHNVALRRCHQEGS